MRRFSAAVLSIILAASLSIWGISPALADEATTQNNEVATDKETNSSGNNYNFIPEGLTLETIDEAIEKDYTSKIETLCSEGESLLSEITSYEDYFNNVDKVQAFYEKIVTETEILCRMLQEYAALYTELIINSNLEDEEKAAAMEGVYTIVYKNAYDAIDSQLYRGLLDELTNTFLNGILKSMPEDAWADEYHYLVADEKLWNEDARDDVYYFNYKTHKAVKYLCDEESFILPYGNNTRAAEVLANFNETLTKSQPQGVLADSVTSNNTDKLSTTTNENSAATSKTSSSTKEEYTPGWHEKDGAWYYFDKSGGICINQWVDSKYYVGSDGKMVTNDWVDNYYLGSDGAYVTDTWIDGYYVGSNGAWIPNYGVTPEIETNNTTYANAENERQACWTPKGECYHSSSCSTLSRSKTIIYGTVAEAEAIGKRDCSKC